MSETGKQRLLSLDVLRGLTVVGMILVNSMAGMKYGAEAGIHPLLLHAHWDGLMLADIVFPAFLMMVGVSIPLALTGARERGGETGAILARTARQDGLRSLREHAIRKVAAGVTSFEEAMRATADVEGPP